MNDMKVYLYLIGIILFITACQSNDSQLIGAWDDQRGQILVFEGEGEGQWIFYKKGRDTFDINYTVDASADPSTLDLSLKKGALEGKSLYCIYKFNKKGDMLCDCEREKSARPTDFGSRQAKTYVRIDNK